MIFHFFFFVSSSQLSGPKSKRSEEVAQSVPKSSNQLTISISSPDECVLEWENVRCEVPCKWTVGFQHKCVFAETPWNRQFALAHHLCTPVEGALKHVLETQSQSKVLLSCRTSHVPLVNQTSRCLYGVQIEASQGEGERRKEQTGRR